MAYSQKYKLAQSRAIIQRQRRGLMSYCKVYYLREGSKHFPPECTIVAISYTAQLLCMHDELKIKALLDVTAAEFRAR